MNGRIANAMGTDFERLICFLVECLVKSYLICVLKIFS